jgi:hypothetical protein
VQKDAASCIIRASDVWFGRNGYLYELSTFGDGFNELLPVAHTITLL